jgi:hypothetical protein
MSYIDELNSVFALYSVDPEAQAEIRHLFAVVKKDAERQGFSEGWNEGQSLCDLDR